MKAARYAGLLAGTLLLQAMPAVAGEGSALRGLKHPSSDYALGLSPYGVPAARLGLQSNDDEGLPGFASRTLLFSGGAYTGRRVVAGDYDFRLGRHQPAGQNIAALAEPSVHSLQDTLPRYTLHTHVTRALPGGWGLGFGVRQTEYNFAAANLLALSAERSFGSVRGAYTLYSNRVEGSTLGAAHRFEVSYLYGDRNTIGLAYTTGRDIDNPALSPTVTSPDVRDWTLSGRHWVSPNWALTYDLLSQEQQGTLFRRQGLRLGVSRSF